MALSPLPAQDLAAKKPFARIGILTSGGDAQGMNAAVRAAIRAALYYKLDIYAIYEGYMGMVHGGDYIRRMTWETVGGILHKGGTVIGTARSAEFRTREGRLSAAKNLLEHEIDHLIIIGGDGSLTGANLFRQEWTGLLDELVANGQLTRELADRHPTLYIAGMVGSIDNDMAGTETTIGADTALHRITEALDALTSTAASHQRAFVVEVMGRRCGYLALMAALASGADWVIIPENPPSEDNWEDRMCEILAEGRQVGRRDSIVVVAEGAQDRHGKPITSQYIKTVLEDKLGEDTRITILGHVQRGGTPSAYDRNMSTILGFRAVEELLRCAEGEPAFFMGVQGSRVVKLPLMENVALTHYIGDCLSQGRFREAMDLRGKEFADAFRVLKTMVRAHPSTNGKVKKPLRIGILNAGGPAPGMNATVRASVRMAIEQGHSVMGIRYGFRGLLEEGNIRELGWMSVNGWAPVGGSELGTSRKEPEKHDLYRIARVLEENNINALMMVGGLAGYRACYSLYKERDNFDAFNIPILCVPVSIDNNLPGTDIAVGSDTALNNIMSAVDKIKQSAVASSRCFVVEVMGRHCGYLAAMSALATGAERVYLPEEGLSLADLSRDVDMLLNGFQHGKRLGLLIRSEHAHPTYTTDFVARVLDAESKGLYSVRQAVLGHLQQGGDPTPADRVLASRFAAHAIDWFSNQGKEDLRQHAFIGLQHNEILFNEMDRMSRLLNKDNTHPRDQWWEELLPIIKVLALPGVP
ncbi:MAG TPA: 6-phosphofructokinase [Anaerolineales bacterium]|nr:6-phosphofructokinase [Anaerolineales bacterium]